MVQQEYQTAERLIVEYPNADLPEPSKFRKQRDAN